MDYWLNLVVDRHGERWSYKDGAWEKLGNRNSMEFGILWFLLMYKLNGSAPIEITKLKCSDCKSIEIKGERYWAIDFKRQKCVGRGICFLSLVWSISWEGVLMVMYIP